MKHFRIIFFALLAFLYNFNLSSQVVFECGHGDDEFQYEDDDEGRTICRPNRNDLQVLPFEYNSTPEKVISLLIHIIRDENGQQNFQNTPSDIARITDYIDRVNVMFSNVAAPVPFGVCIPPSIHVPDTKIRFVISDILFHNHESLYCSDSPLTQYNHWVRDNPNLSQSEKDNNLHVIIASHRGTNGDCSNPVYHVGGQGYPKFTYNRAFYHHPNSSHDIAAHLSHELGHCFGLSHSWTSSAPCDVRHTQS
jgi:hypothetical protein